MQKLILEVKKIIFTEIAQDPIHLIWNSAIQPQNHSRDSFKFWVIKKNYFCMNSIPLILKF